MYRHIALLLLVMLILIGCSDSTGVAPLKKVVLNTTDEVETLYDSLFITSTDIQPGIHRLRILSRRMLDTEPIDANSFELRGIAVYPLAAAVQDCEDIDWIGGVAYCASEAIVLEFRQPVVLKFPYIPSRREYEAGKHVVLVNVHQKVDMQKEGPNGYHHYIADFIEYLSHPEIVIHSHL